MAVQTLALVYSTVTGRVTQSGLTSNAMPVAVARALSALGIVFEPRATEGRLLDKAGFTAEKRAGIITRFNERFGHPRQPVDVVTDSTTEVNDGGTFAAADTTLTVDDGSALAQYDYLRIDDEILQATAVEQGGGHDTTVTRGLFGTTDAAHVDNTVVYIVATYALTITSV